LVIYLIEGSFIQKDHHFRCGVTRDALYSSIVNRVIRDQFTIYRTADINDTALVVTKIYDKLVANCPGDNSQAVGTSQQLEYLKTIKMAKKDNMDPYNCYLCQLAQIPGVSLDMAQIVATKYGSMAQLIRALEVPDTVHLLENLMMPLVNGKSRRLGPVVSKRICEYLCGKHETSETPPTVLVKTEGAPITQKIKITLKQLPSEN
jgi:ERCC4-type nuclease